MPSKHDTSSESTFDENPSSCSLVAILLSVLGVVALVGGVIGVVVLIICCDDKNKNDDKNKKVDLVATTGQVGFQFQGSKNYKPQKTHIAKLLQQDLTKLLQGEDVGRTVYWDGPKPEKAAWVFHSWKSETSKAFQADESKPVSEEERNKILGGHHMAACQMRSKTAIDEKLNEAGKDADASGLKTKPDGGIECRRHQRAIWVSDIDMDGSKDPAEVAKQALEVLKPTTLKLVQYKMRTLDKNKAADKVLDGLAKDIFNDTPLTAAADFRIVTASETVLDLTEENLRKALESDWLDEKRDLTKGGELYRLSWDADLP